MHGPLPLPRVTVCICTPVTASACMDSCHCHEWRHASPAIATACMHPCQCHAMHGPCQWPPHAWIPATATACYGMRCRRSLIRCIWHIETNYHLKLRALLYNIWRQLLRHLDCSFFNKLFGMVRLSQVFVELQSRANVGLLKKVTGHYTERRHWQCGGKVFQRPGIESTILHSWCVAHIWMSKCGLGYCPCEGNGQSIGSAVSDVIVRSWLWSTVTWRCPLGYFGIALLQVVHNLPHEHW